MSNYHTVTGLPTSIAPRFLSKTDEALALERTFCKRMMLAFASMVGVMTLASSFVVSNFGTRFDPSSLGLLRPARDEDTLLFSRDLFLKQRPGPGTGDFVTTLGLDTVPRNLRSVFESAKNRYERIIVGDLPDHTVDAEDRAFTDCPSLPNVIDDTYICALVEDLDDGILGLGGPDLIRFDWNLQRYTLPYVGSMIFNRNLINLMIREGIFLDTILHEMSHVYGIGTLWEDNGLATAGPNCVYKFDSKASQRYRELSGCTNRAIPLDRGENLCGHWDDCLNEIMSAYATGTAALSVLTVASLDDLGYEVNYGAADRFDRSQMDASCVCNRRRSLFTGNFGLTNEDGDFSSADTGWGAVLRKQRQPRRKLSDDGHAKATAYGKRILEERHARTVGLSLNNGGKYVGDKVVSVLYMEEGNVYSVEVTAFQG